MSPELTTSLFMPAFDPQPIVAEVLAADATATTYLLNCREGADECGIHDNTLVVGPWTSKTLPPGAAATGELNYRITDSYNPWLYSVKCQMSHTVPLACTTTNSGGNDEDRQTATFTGTEAIEDELHVYLTFTSVIVTAGQELLISTTSASETSTSETGQTSKTAPPETVPSETAPATPTHPSGNATSTDTSSSSASTPEETSGGVSYVARGFAAIALAGFAAIMVQC